MSGLMPSLLKPRDPMKPAGLQTGGYSTPSPSPPNPLAPTGFQAGNPYAPRMARNDGQIKTGGGTGMVRNDPKPGVRPKPAPDPLTARASGYTPSAGGMPDRSLENRVASIMGKDSPFMTQARTAGLQGANQRGLLSSSMAVGAAQGAAYNAAVPIASQDDQQAHEARLTNWQLASQDRGQAASLLSNMQQYYNQQYETIMANPNLKAEDRTRYLSDLKNIYNMRMNLLEQLYNIDLRW